LYPRRIVRPIFFTALVVVALRGSAACDADTASRDPERDAGAAPAAPEDKKDGGGADGGDAATVTPYARVFAGADATCAVRKDDGSLWCWGDNYGGVLRDGTEVSRWSPVLSQGPGQAFDELGLAHGLGCILTPGGAVSCWGESGGPSTPTGLSGGVRGLNVRGLGTNCAVMVDGTVKCWGGSRRVFGSDLSPTVPTTIAGLTGIRTIDVSNDHACALTNAGSVTCLGGNVDGQLGDGTTTGRLTPREVPGLAGVKRVVVGAGLVGNAFSCALTNAGAVKCWGMSAVIASGERTASPVDVPGLASGVTDIVAGMRRACALLDTGGVKCWGLGPLGDGTEQSSGSPVDVLGLNDAVAIVAGAYHQCALRSSGAVACWGTNDHGQLGTGEPWRTVPVDVALPAPVTSLSSAGDAVAAIAAGAMGWGASTANQVLPGSSKGTSPPFTLSPLAGTAQVELAPSFGCARDDGGGVKCWGSNISGQVGSGTSAERVLAPEQVQGLTTGATDVSVGSGHACAVVGGGVKCWGDNEYGQLGDGTKTDRPTPVTLAGATSGVLSVVAGDKRTCVRTADNAVRCVGVFPGNGTPESTSLVDVVASGVTALGGSSQRTCVADGTSVRCWSSTGPAPSPVPGLSGAIAIAGSPGHTCVVTPAGGVKCWGTNGRGQLGDGTLLQRTEPVDVVGLSSGVVRVVAGDEHTCALTARGGVKCWGANAACQLGLGPCGGLAPTVVR